MLISRYFSLCFAVVLTAVLLLSFSPVLATGPEDEIPRASFNCDTGESVEAPDFAPSDSSATRVEGGFRIGVDSVVPDLHLALLGSGVRSASLTVGFHNPADPLPPPEPTYYFADKGGNRHIQVLWDDPGWLGVVEWKYNGPDWDHVVDTTATGSVEGNQASFFVPQGSVGEAQRYYVVLFVLTDQFFFNCHTFGLDLEAGPLLRLPLLIETTLDIEAPGEVKIGEDFEIAMRFRDWLDNPLSGQTVMLELTKEDMVVTLDAVTDEDGTASVEHAFRQAGTWKALSWYGGSNVFAQATVEREIEALPLFVDITFAGPEMLPFTLDVTEGSVEAAETPDGITLTALEYPSTVSLELLLPWEYSTGSRVTFINWSDGSTLNPWTFTIAEDAEYELNLGIEHLVSFETMPSECGVDIEPQWQQDGSLINPANIYPDVLTMSEWERCLYIIADPSFVIHSAITLIAEYQKEYWFAYDWYWYGDIPLEEAEAIGILEWYGYSLEEAREVLGRWFPEEMGVEVPTIPDTFSTEAGVRGVRRPEIFFYDEHGNLIGTVEEGEMIWSPGTAVAEYSPEYLLDLISEYGRVTGRGWYPPGTVVEWAVTPSTVTMDGFLGLLGGLLMAEHVEGTVIMNEWTTVVVAWTANYLAPGLTLGVTIALFAGLLVAYWARHLVRILTVGLMAVALSSLAYLYWAGNILPALIVGVVMVLFTFLGMPYLLASVTEEGPESWLDYFLHPIDSFWWLISPKKKEIRLDEITPTGWEKAFQSMDEEEFKAFLDHIIEELERRIPQSDPPKSELLEKTKGVLEGAREGAESDLGLAKTTAAQALRQLSAVELAAMAAFIVGEILKAGWEFVAFGGLLKAFHALSQLLRTGKLRALIEKFTKLAEVYHKLHAAGQGAKAAEKLDELKDTLSEIQEAVEE